jgi:hypothetical protein
MQKNKFFLFGLLGLEMVALRCFLREKKGLCPLGVRPWICVFFIYFIYLFISMDQEAMSMLIILIF